MPSAYTPSLKLILQATGENSGNWGNLTNTDFTSLIELAVAGYESISMVDADRTLTNGDGSTANEARYAFINMVSSVALTVARNVIVPTASKLYFFKNATTGGFAVTLKTTAGTGISVPNGKVMVLMCDGTNVIDAVTSFSSLTLATALPVTSGGTGVTTSTGSGSNVLSTSPTLVTPALGTPSALVGTNITGTATSFTASNVTTNANLTGAVTSVGNAASLGSFTSAQLATALTDETGTGANVFATSPTLVTPALGTPSAIVLTNATSVPVNQATGTLPVANGGTGTTTSTGTGSNVLSISPTFTGTVGVAALNTTGKLGVGTATPAGIFSVKSTTSTGTSTSSWSNAYSTFGPNAGSTSGAALGLGYNTTTDRSEVLSLAAGTAWKPMTVYTAGVQFAAQAGTEAMRVVSNDAAVGVVSMALRLSCNSTTDTNAIVAMGLGVQNDGFSKGGIGWVRGGGSDIGSLAFYNNGKGDSSNISTADEAMRVDSSKILLVGTTSATGTSKLQVNSDALINGLTVGIGKNSVASNTAIGYQALNTNSTGSSNVAVGYGTLYSNVTGDGNTAVGTNALNANTASGNTAVGQYALSYNTSGANCVALGSGASNYSVSASRCTAIGVNALVSNVSGSDNIAIGYNALNLTGTASSVSKGNVAIGYQAGNGITSGSGNTIINPLTGASFFAPIFAPTTEDNRFCMGSTAVTNAYIQVAWTVVSDARDKTNFASIPHGLDFVNQLKPTAFQFRKSREDETPTGPVRYGFKAQDVLALEGSNPVVVDAEDSEKLRFNESSLIPILVKAIQELTARIAVLEAK